MFDEKVKYNFPLHKETERLIIQVLPFLLYQEQQQCQQVLLPFVLFVVRAPVQVPLSLHSRLGTSWELSNKEPGSIPARIVSFTFSPPLSFSGCVF
jgi:hypothetical protein